VIVGGSRRPRTVLAAPCNWMDACTRLSPQSRHDAASPANHRRQIIGPRRAMRIVFPPSNRLGVVRRRQSRNQLGSHCQPRLPNRGAISDRMNRATAGADHATLNDWRDARGRGMQCRDALDRNLAISAAAPRQQADLRPAVRVAADHRASR